MVGREYLKFANHNKPMLATFYAKWLGLCMPQNDFLSGYILTPKMLF